jgi:cobalt-zinc-cadmium efflux system membrane fusion protein
MALFGGRVGPVAAIIVAGIAAGALILTVDPPTAVDPHGHGEEEGHDEHAERAHEEEGAPRVAMTDEAIRTAEIEIKTAGIAALTLGGEYPGEVRANENHVAHVVPRLDATAREVRRNVGDSVRRGEILAVLDAIDLADARGSYLSAVSRLELARQNAVRAESLWRRRIAPERDYHEARQGFEEIEIEARIARQRLLAFGLTESDLANSTLTWFPVRAPLDGVIVEKHIAPGEAVAKDASIFVLADLSTVWVEIAVPARDINAVRVGQKVEVVSEALNERQEGHVAFVSPALGEAARTSRAFVEIPDPKGRWRPGLFVTVRLAQQEIEVPVAIRAAGLQTLENRTVVFVRKDESFEARSVEVGRRLGGWVEILSGLKPGDKYAAGNSFVVKAEMGKASAGHDH